MVSVAIEARQLRGPLLTSLLRWQQNQGQPLEQTINNQVPKVWLDTARHVITFHYADWAGEG